MIIEISEVKSYITITSHCYIIAIMFATSSIYFIFIFI